MYPKGHGTFERKLEYDLWPVSGTSAAEAARLRPRTARLKAVPLSKAIELRSIYLLCLRQRREKQVLRYAQDDNLGTSLPLMMLKKLNRTLMLLRRFTA